ncbi:tRNA (adenosine(37)-N6)-dimethylallyltransferase MiaA [Geomicrobium sediminis]|uniref:tRNA dimethylallyltransferase n=1 Tax=Geomicrobium sediminis TaxID=1347788 RepID=A0ABS2PC35_9BACL|nr:tRNA (adenosine(37)-N6)-dimethylallyltransferase MiaA [Geomicrobium sediminis]MBM7632671.1 tRNA dimethylallyltransferase [Geomicrobium sediminis]
MKRPLVVIVGPTAVGKTALGIALSKAFNGEVINGDAFQVYERLNIGTAKVTEEEKDNVPHHLLDIKKPDESFSAAEFQRTAKETITDIHERKRLPILVGGTGMYVKGVTSDWSFQEEKADRDVQQQLEAIALEPNGNERLHARLHSLDQAAAARIHPNNIRKMIRAIELLERGHDAPKPLQSVDNSPYDLIMIGLTMDRSSLYERIERRVDVMLEQGLFEEVQQLYEEGLRDEQAMKAIGYKEWIDYFEGKASFEHVVETIKTHSRQFAKRQLTWFRNKETVHWFDSEQEKHDHFTGIVQFLAGELEKMSN